jgi:predicted ATPase with chaperone activity
MQLAAIASAADLKSRLSELEELRERVREALEIAGATKVPNWKATVNLRPANI